MANRVLGKKRRGYGENVTPCISSHYIGANDLNRTDDLLITSELLYRLSYVGPAEFER